MAAALASRLSRATVVALELFFFLDDIAGFEITYLLELPEPFNFIFTWFAAVPAIVYLALSLTKLIIKDFWILKVVISSESSGLGDEWTHGVKEERRLRRSFKEEGMKSTS